jgi:hypothetical protein
MRIWRQMTRAGRNFDLLKKAKRHFGGMLLKGNAKTARPLSSKNAIHLVLKSEQAIGPKSMLNPKNIDRVNAIVHEIAKKKFIEIYSYVNVGNHLHLVIKLKRRFPFGQEDFREFIRAVTGLIARHILKAERNHAVGLHFWQARPFTRIVSWGQDFKRLMSYMSKNISQARSVIIDWGFSVTDLDQITGLRSG